MSSLELLYLLAAVLALALGIAHSFLGEKYILIRLFRRNDLPKLFGGTQFTVRTLRFAWHLTSVAWWAAAALLFLLAQGPLSSAAVSGVLAAMFLVSGGVTLIASRSASRLAGILGHWFHCPLWSAGLTARPGRASTIESGYDMKKTNHSQNLASASRQIDASIKQLGDWRGATLSRIRRLIKQADPEVVEELKWKKPSAPAGVPVWSHDGIICTGETYKTAVKLTFLKGAQLKDPKRLFNSSLEGNARRAIDLHEGDEIDATAFVALIREAVALNKSSAR